MSELAKALLKVQAEAPALQKTAFNPHFKSKFVPLETVMDEILPLLNANGIVLVQSPTLFNGLPALKTKLLHAESEEHIEDTMPLVYPSETPQGQGAALTYARRYALVAMLGLVGERDTDGHVESREKPKAEPQSPATEEKATEGQHRMLAQLLATLEETHPHGDPNGPTWTDEARGYCKEQFGKQSRADLSKAEMSRLIDEMEERKKVLELPFA